MKYKEIKKRFEKDGFAVRLKKIFSLNSYALMAYV